MVAGALAMSARTGHTGDANKISLAGTWLMCGGRVHGKGGPTDSG